MLRRAREAKGWTQKMVGARLRGEPEGAAIHKYETGKGKPDLDRMGELIAVLDLDEEEAWRAYLREKLPDDVLEGLADRPGSWIGRA